MLRWLSTESCTAQGENKGLTSAFWCTATCHFLIGSRTFHVRGDPLLQHAISVRCLLSFPQQGASGNSLAWGRLQPREASKSGLSHRCHRAPPPGADDEDLLHPRMVAAKAWTVSPCTRGPAVVGQRRRIYAGRACRAASPIAMATHRKPNAAGVREAG